MPWAGIVALIVVVLLDAALLGSRGPWERIFRALPYDGSLYTGVARDRTQLQKIRAADPEQPRILIFGTSRANRGFNVVRAERGLPGASLGQMAHQMMDPFAILSLVDESVAAGADAVVLLLSQFDTHRPLRIEPIPGKSSASLAAIGDLTDAAGAAFAWQIRDSLYRIAASSALGSYRFRDVLGRTGLNRTREFALDDRLDSRGFALMRGPAALGEPREKALGAEEREELLERLSPRLRSRAPRQFGWFTETRRGEHARVQMALVRRIVERLRDADVEVFIVECPLHPLAADIEERGTRAEFAALASDLASETGAHFLRLEAMPPFEANDFNDLLHLGPSGSEKLTAAVISTLHEHLPNLAPPQRPPPGP
ncbi:MAG: hypothetical protein JRG96_11865 [Deltaproteobacteria bacterium]|nr:hypothetical protein [Deltaproteobacteria bacterium]MBW2421439.1 hypothetical protein [Deltaproteobacteria bacterium]